MKLAGFPDLGQGQLELLGRLKARMLEQFRAYGYAILEPPIVDLADAFIERSGEEIRNRMYFFEDPRGRDLCLRPELTIPVCRMLLRSEWNRAGVVRMGYCGPVFRYESAGRGRYRQFHQVGAECVGHGKEVVADAEIVSLAAETLRAAGVGEPWLRMGDIRFLERMLASLNVPPATMLFVKRALSQGRGAGALHDLLSGDEHKPVHAGAGLDEDGFLQVLAELGPAKSVKLIERFLAVSDISLVGTRRLEDIVERLTSKPEGTLAAIPHGMIERIEEFLAFQGEPRATLARLAAFAKSAGLPIEDLVASSLERLGYIEALGIDTSKASFDAGFCRTVDYYTGFIFEFYPSSDALDMQLVGGGRYDELIGFLEPGLKIPAVGFAAGVERVLLVRDEATFARPVELEAAADALIVAAGPVDEGVLLQSARAFRAAGWNVQVDLAGRRPRKAIVDALEKNIPYVVIAGEAEASAGQIVVRDLASKAETKVEIAALEAFARNLKQAGGK